MTIFRTPGTISALPASGRTATAAPARSAHGPGSRAAGTGRAAVILNPSRFSPAGRASLQTAIEAVFLELGRPAPLWLVTTAETRGADEARAAVAAEVEVVLVVGGDGTIRTVAQELAGSGVALAVLPVGTGNLLARNLGIPRHDVAAAVRLACSGTDHRIDVGWLQLEHPEAGSERFAFLVMAGAGFDAATMAGADPVAKARLGRGAYLLSGARAIGRRMSRTTVTVDGVRHLPRDSRGVIVGNCGSLAMGLNLLPAADPGDGLLDGVVLHQRSVLDWLAVLCSVVRGGRRASASHRLMPRMRGRAIEVRTDLPQPVEVDGDVVGHARRVRFTVQPAALLVRCP